MLVTGALVDNMLVDGAALAALDVTLPGVAEGPLLELPPDLLTQYGF